LKAANDPDELISQCFLETDNTTSYAVWGAFVANLEQRIASITANLDDLQSGLEACTRAADILQADTAKLNGLVGAPLRRSVARHVKEMRACARDQRAALRELRESIANLRKELQSRRRGIRPLRPGFAQAPIG
jgi:hypothetical protein